MAGTGIVTGSLGSDVADCEIERLREVVVALAIQGDEFIVVVEPLALRPIVAILATGVAGAVEAAMRAGFQAQAPVQELARVGKRVDNGAPWDDLDAGLVQCVPRSVGAIAWRKTYSPQVVRASALIP